MATMPFLIAFAIAGGHVTFAGAVATPTAADAPVVAQASQTAIEQRITVRTGRFEGPPRVVSIQPMGHGGERTVVIVTYL